ncbi:SWI/SNF complex subunit SWI3A isoform X2 [Amaranthus tricolor]|uniref:SWI/SNF complex subunit SWI3A isoform X2 n=1 Tax=Amaranthus tricolor TaxID=29722 RepID=UPI002586E5D5|nr:SWI/SNF complex subunit SWI3A isoform X2 [Amaranthus tricolor]
MENNLNSDRLPPSSFKPTSLPSHLDLYTIPSHSFWFSWDSIHDTERLELREFFDGSSFTRTPKIYKEYRDFIISKYREDPSKRLTFTEVRKSLVGDVSTLNKLFNFLDKWGLINFGAPPPPPVQPCVDESVKVRVEEGAPIGVRVVGTPNTLKPLKAPLSVSGDEGRVDNGFKLPPLASFTDVFRDSGGENGVLCGNCKEKCESKYYECTKEKFSICLKCFEKGAYGENKSADDFTLKDSVESNANQAGWTEAETLLLVESVLKHGDDWELVAQNVHTKTKLECISRLIELPFGELMLGSHGKLPVRDLVDDDDTSIEQKASIVSLENEKMEINQREGNQHEGNHLEDSNHLENNHDQENGHHHEIGEKDNGGNNDNLEPPLKKSRVDSLVPNRSLMEQVALISTMVAPPITAAAANAAVTVLCDGNPLLREVFYTDDTSIDEQRSGNLNKEMERTLQSEDLEMKDASNSSEIEKLSPEGDSIPLALRMRVAVGTALGAAAAHAKLLADHEEREIEQLMAFIIETQLKKVQRKAELFEVLERMMEKEHALLEESKDDIIRQRITTLQTIFSEGISHQTDHYL